MGKNNSPQIFVGKTGGEHYKEFKDFYLENYKDDDIDIKKMEQDFYKYLRQEKKYSVEDSERVSKYVSKRYENNLKEKVTKKEKEIEQRAKEKDKVRIGNPGTTKQYKPLDKEFDKWLLKSGRNINRDREDIGIDIQDYLEEKSKKVSEGTLNKIQSAINYFQINKYQVELKGNEVKKALRCINKVRRNTNIKIQIEKKDMKRLDEAIRHVHKTFRHTKGEAKQSDHRKRGLMEQYAMWFIKNNPDRTITQSTKNDYLEFNKYMQSVGMKTEQIKKYNTALRQYARNGDWKEKMFDKDKDVGAPRRQNAVIDRAWRTGEVSGAMELAYNGTGKQGGAKRMDVYYSIGAMRLMGLRIEECVLLTTEQLINAVNDSQLHLTKTKNKTPRNIDKEVLEMYHKELKMFIPLIEECIEKGIKNPIYYLTGKTDVKEAKQCLQSWFNKHRHKFQDEDRVNKKGVLAENQNKNRKDIEIEKVWLTAHGLRHSFNQDCFNYYIDKAENRLKTDKSYGEELYQLYIKEKQAFYKVKKWGAFKPDINKREEYIQYQLNRECARKCSFNAGHQRPSVTKIYLVRKVGDNTTVYIDPTTFQQYVYTDKEVTEV